VVVTVASLLVGWLAACRDQPAPEVAEEVTPPSRAVDVPVDAAPTSTPSTYDPDLGPLLVVPVVTDGSGRLASVLSPLQPAEVVPGDTTGLATRAGAGRVALFARRGLVAERTLDLALLQPGGTSACPAWPLAPFQPEADSAGLELPVPRAWLVGVPAGRATAVPLDSIEALLPRDSAALAATLTRLASGLADDSTSAFVGLPFAVRRAWRSRDLDDPIVLAVLVRRIPQEDRPLEERTTLAVSARGAPREWRIAWFDRMSGREEEVIATEPLAVLQVGSPPHLAVLLGRDDGTGTALALLERVNGRWRMRWESPVTGC
jgi:hypothetical protein